jgi:hypothetical protein
LEGYVGDLEIICSLSFQRDREHRQTVSLDADDHSWKDELMSVWNNEDTAETFRNIWRQSELFKQLRMRNPNVESMDENFFRKKHFGEGSFHAAEATQDLDFSTESTIIVDDCAAGTEISISKSQQSDTSSLQQLQTTQIPSVDQPLSLTTMSPVLPSRSWHLLDIYFTHTHSWLPIVEKHDILKTYHEYSTRGGETPKSSPISESRAVLWSILAFADVQFASIDTSNMEEQERASLSTGDLYAYARSLIPREDGVFGIGHVQSLLLLSLLNLGAGKSQAAWLLSGQAVRIALQLELHQQRDASLHSAKISVMTRGKHVFLGCFAVDTLIAAQLGRPPHLTTEDIDAIGEGIEENGLEEWDAWSDSLGSKRQEPSSPHPPLICSTFNKLLVTMRALNQLAREVSSNRTDNSSIKTTISTLHASHNNKNGPEQLSLPWSPGTILLPHHFNLHLAYLTVMMSFLLRQHELFKVGNAAESTFRDLSHLVIQTSHILTKFEDSFGLVIAPPITEYFVSILRDSYRLLERNSLVYTNGIDGNWRATLQIHISNMHKVWPSFGNLHRALQKDLMTQGATAMVISQNGSGLSQGFASESCSVESPLDFTAGMVGHNTNNGCDEFDKTSNRQLETEIFQPSNSFTLMSGSNRTAITHLNGRSASAQKKNTTTTSDSPHPSEPAGDADGVGNSSAFSADPLNNTNPSSMPELYTNVNPDVVFNEFAILDAMEWYVVSVHRLALNLTALQDWHL